MVHINTMYTEQQVVDFGNYLFRRYDVQEYSTDGKNTPLFQRQVSDADVANWKQESPSKIAWLPSLFKDGDKAWFTFDPENQQGMGANCEILCVHFYPGKVKYDIEVTLSDGTTTRLYNIDSCFVVSRRVS